MHDGQSTMPLTSLWIVRGALLSPHSP